MTSPQSPDSSAFAAKIDAVLAEQRTSLDTLTTRSAERAARGTADAAAATERFRRLAERVQQRAKDRARPAPAAPKLSADDPVAELESQAEALDDTPPDPTAPSEAEVEDILDTMRPLAPPPEPAEPEAELPDTSLRQWSDTKQADAPSEDLDADFDEPW